MIVRLWFVFEYHQSLKISGVWVYKDGFVTLLGLGVTLADAIGSFVAFALAFLMTNAIVTLWKKTFGDRSK
jgi:hypothetical protein